MDLQIFEAYLKQTQQIAQRLPADPGALLDLMQIIEQHKDLIGNHSKDWEEFFKGEANFYSGQYEKALQHYLAAKEIPHYHFFCFRTSCFVARARGNQEQSINFAKKALKLNPSDESLKQFLHDLTATPTPKSNENIPKISLGEKEIAELASIFEEPRESHEELFAHEFTTVKSTSSLGLEEEKLQESSVLTQQQELPFEVTYVEETPQETPQETLISRLPPQESTYYEAQQNLTERLYTPKRLETNEETPLSALKRLAEQSVQTYSTEKMFAKNVDLEERIENFQSSQVKRLHQYLNYTNERTAIADNALFVLSGWDKNLSLEVDAPHQANTQGLILTEYTRKSCGGLFLRWNSKGVVINPGAGFLNHFHEQGFSLQDIHYVIVTQDHYSAYADIKAIYELNNKLNQLGEKLHIINYYLNQKAYQELTAILKPNFKQARHTVHSLELFLDSPDVEKMELGDDIVLNYFLATHSDRHFNPNTGKERSSRTTLGIRLDLNNHPHSQTPVRLGYVSGTAWSPLLSHHLGLCEVLVAGFGNTAPNDYAKTSYQTDSLGYYGSYSLIEEIAPRLFVSTEFDGREGDYRLEAIKKLRQEINECGRKAAQGSTIIPGDIALHVSLADLKIQCSVTGEYIEPQNIRIAKAIDSFGRLSYLSPACYL